MQAAAWSPPAGTLGVLVAAARERAAAMVSRRADLEARALDAAPSPSFAAALRGGDVAIIAEVKRRSPSKGAIKPGLDAGTQAVSYERGGAAAISVLTEPAYFGGSESDLVAVRQLVTIPLLKKDFHVHRVQLLEAKALGASAALLIARALSPDDLIRLVGEAREIALETLVEVRDRPELDRAMAVGATVIGVNNRDLETLEVDPRRGERILPLVPADRIAVAESGMRSRGDVTAAAGWGADAVLIGSSLSAASDPEAAVRSLTGVARARRD